MNFTVRIATKEDHPILLDFEQGIVEAERPFDETLKEGVIHYYNLIEYINSNLAEVFVAEHEGEIIASGFVRIEDEEEFRKHDRIAYLGFMYVKERYRGKAVNKKILDALLDWSKSKGIHEVLLEVYDGNEAAIRAYEKAGFKKRLIEMRRRI